MSIEYLGFASVHNGPQHSLKVEIYRRLSKISFYINGKLRVD